VLRGLQKRRPAVFNIYTPCPVEHGLRDDVAMRAARLALESRAFPFLTFDPDAGPFFADALSLEGNPSLDQKWPEYNIEYVDDAGGAQRMTLPLTIADWAATEGRFKKHFKAVDRSQWNEDMVPFHEYLELSSDDREGKTAYILTTDRDRHLSRLAVSNEIVQLAEERQQLWSQLRELAGVLPSATVRDRLIAEVESAYQAKLDAMRAEYEARLAALPKALAHRMAETLLRGGGGKSVGDLLSSLSTMPRTTGAPAVIAPKPESILASVVVKPVTGSGAAKLAAAPAKPATLSATTATSAVAVADDDLAIDPYIDSARCTSCNECTNLNAKLFAYNAQKQATVADPSAGTFQQLVVAAERCPVGAIHPGTPRNPKEKDLAKWVKRAEPFN
jgi:pyruvate-ferredoxin/flavodoxin oxidoreductase